MPTENGKIYSVVAYSIRIPTIWDPQYMLLLYTKQIVESQVRNSIIVFSSILPEWNNGLLIFML